MISFTISSNNSSIIETVRNALTKIFSDDLEIEIKSEPHLIIDHLHYDAPQFILFDLDDASIEADKVIKEVASDPLLFSIRVLGLTEKPEEDIPVYPGLFSIMNPSQLNSLLPHIVHILSSNQQLLLQKGLLQNIGRKGTLTIDNDPLFLEGYAELLSNFLYSQNLISTQSKYGIKFSLVEMLMNALEHGNCRISYEEKSQWLDEGKDIVILIKEKIQDPLISAKKIKLQYEIQEHNSIFIITDEGEGFDVNSLPDRDDVMAVMELHGRGIFMTQNYVNELRYNDKGNEVTLNIVHMENPERSVPEGFLKSAVIDFNAGDVVFYENDKSNTLYYIIDGEFEVLANDKVITTLNNTSIFLGEMAFLLGNRRTATICAKTRGRLVAINALEWMQAVQKYPYYGIFLSRLLADKLDHYTHHSFN